MKSFAPGQTFTKYCIKPELSWSCRQVMVCWFILPCFVQNAKPRANAGSSPAKVLLPRGFMSLSNILELSTFLFVEGASGREGEEVHKSCQLACEHRKCLLQDSDSVSLCLLCSISKHQPATPIPTFLLRLISPCSSLSFEFSTSIPSFNCLGLTGQSRYNLDLTPLAGSPP